jgi:hypothetical protein
MHVHKKKVIIGVKGCIPLCLLSYKEIKYYITGKFYLHIVKILYRIIK